MMIRVQGLGVFNSAKYVDARNKQPHWTIVLVNSQFSDELGFLGLW